MFLAPALTYFSNHLAAGTLAAGGTSIEGTAQMTEKKIKPDTAKPDDLPALKEPTSAEKDLGQKVASPVPRLKITKNGLSIDHPDQKVGELLMMPALGAKDRDFMYGMLKQLANASSQGLQANESELNFMVSVVKDIKPRDQIEAMLAAQMASVHLMAMRFANYLANTEEISQQDSGQRVFNKLTRTFPAQMDALKRYRSSGEQSVTVQNVSVQDGGQAIVGNVSQHALETAQDKTAISPPAITDARMTPMAILGELEHEPVPARRKSDT
jgi:hypothetical protein